MNLQEREQLSHFLKQLGDVKLSAKDAEAEALIREATASQPDAAYLLVQRTLLLEQALNSANAQINDLQNQLQNSQPAARSGFLNSDPWAQPPSNPGQVPGAGNYQMPRYANPAQAPASAPAPAFGGASSFLGNVATTAAGVVAGSFLAQGIGSLLGHHQSSPWEQPHHASASDEATADHTTINNFYGSDAEPQAFHEASYSELVSDDTDDFQDDGGDSGWI